MLSVKRLIQTRSKAEGRTFLKYSDVPFGTQQVRVCVRDIRETPKLNSPAVLDIEPEIYVDGVAMRTDKTSVPLNLTNLQALSNHLQTDDSIAVRGKDVLFGFSMKYNPREDEETMGLDLIGVEIHSTPPAPAPKTAAARK
jgi:hypothetical protein